MVALMRNQGRHGNRAVLSRDLLGRDIGAESSQAIGLGKLKSCTYETPIVSQNTIAVPSYVLPMFVSLEDARISSHIDHIIVFHIILIILSYFCHHLF